MAVQRPLAIFRTSRCRKKKTLPAHSGGLDGTFEELPNQRFTFPSVRPESLAYRTAMLAGLTSSWTLRQRLTDTWCLSLVPAVSAAKLTFVR
jgi:hypothetical protein